MQTFQNVAVPRLGFGGLDADLTDEEREVQRRIREFALGVMRPAAARLDPMAAADVVAPESPLWEYLTRFEELGINPAWLASLGPHRLKRMLPLVFEELAYGDAGLAVAAFTSKMPAAMAMATRNPELVERFSPLRGCWIAILADRGSDAIDHAGFELAKGARQSEGSLRAVVTASEVTLNGVSSDWISCAPIAECALVHCPADYGNGIARPDGGVFGVAVLVPFDLPGIERGRAVEKIGQRTLPTGHVRFDNVRVPASYIIRGQDQYYASMAGTHTSGAMNVAAIATGVAKAAFDHTLDYARSREQGGATLIAHQHVRWRLWEMWRKLETCRASVRRGASYNFSEQGPHLLASITAKTTATQTAFEVAMEAVQIFGANGLSRDFAVERLLRDVTVCLIQGGENHSLGLQGGNWLLHAHGADGIADPIAKRAAE
ncbi:acyl-CoA dehydrogenase [Inquilinus ginsengisoli]|uniref:acyl-CoA dehydrogenase family protein n=1 Tax=Inquilinus ginsengisoli TaxID=363840 RepID=UPI003D1C6FB1